MPDPWSKFFWSDWEADQGLRLCSLSAQGLWMRMLCVCARHEPKGYLAINGNPLAVDAIARLAGVAETEAETLMAELERNGVFSRNRSGCIYSRRMVRDEKRSQEGRKHKKRGLSQAAENTEKISRPSRGAARGASAQKPEARSQIDKKDAYASSSEEARAVEEYNAAAARAGWSAVQRVTKPRISSLKARLREVGGLEGWRAALDRAEASDFLCGRRPGRDGPFFASFDFLVQAQSFTRLMEGNYDNRTAPARPGAAVPNRSENRPDPALANIARIVGLGEAQGHGGG